MNIYVGNLGQETSESELHDLFAEFGEVQSVKIIMDNFTKQSKGFGFVEMDDKEAAEKAVEQLNNTKLNAKYLVVNEARPKTDSPSRGRGGSYRPNNRRY